MLVRQITIINWPNNSSFDFVHISALQDPIAAQGRKPLYWIKRHAWVAPWAARVVHAYRLIDFDFTVYRLSRCECYLAKRYTNAGVNFAASVNLSRIWKRRLSCLRFFDPVVRIHRHTEMSRDPSTSLEMTKNGTQV